MQFASRLCIFWTMWVRRKCLSPGLMREHMFCPEWQSQWHKRVAHMFDQTRSKTIPEHGKIVGFGPNSSPLQEKKHVEQTPWESATSISKVEKYLFHHRTAFTRRSGRLGEGVKSRNFCWQQWEIKGHQNVHVFKGQQICIYIYISLSSSAVFAIWSPSGVIPAGFMVCDVGPCWWRMAFPNNVRKFTIPSIFPLNFNYHPRRAARGRDSARNQGRDGGVFHKE